MSAPAGWHPQPDGRDRYWDGGQWTDHFRPGEQDEAPATSEGIAIGPRTPKLAFYRPWMGYVGAAIIALMIGIGIGGSGNADAGESTSASAPTVTVTSDPEPAATVTEPAATVTTGPTPTVTVTATTKVTAPLPSPVAAITEGTWTVGVDIKAGTYKVIETIDGDCYWKISKTGSNGDDIVSNDIPTGGRPQVVLKKGQDFENAGCGDWKRIK